MNKKKDQHAMAPGTDDLDLPGIQEQLYLGMCAIGLDLEKIRMSRQQTTLQPKMKQSSSNSNGRSSVEMSAGQSYLHEAIFYSPDAPHGEAFRAERRIMVPHVRNRPDRVLRGQIVDGNQYLPTVQSVFCFPWSRWQDSRINSRLSGSSTLSGHRHA